nr:phage integrase N-terminal SAM-like domain-containing protein [Rhodohalobacter halophilus]
MIEDLKNRNYSPRTITVYINRVAKFAQYFGQSPDRLNREHIREYQRYLVEDKKCSWSQLNQTVCALRFFYRVCLNQPTIVEYIPYPSQPKSLPVVLSGGEVYRLLDTARDIKHRTVLMLLYATGVRISEALSLRIGDVDSQRMVIHVRAGKVNSRWRANSTNCAIPTSGMSLLAGSGRPNGWCMSNHRLAHPARS